MTPEQITEEVKKVVAKTIANEAKLAQEMEDKIQLSLYKDADKVKVKILVNYVVKKIVSLKDVIGTIKSALYGNTVNNFIIEHLNRLSAENNATVNAVFAMKDKDYIIWLFNDKKCIKKIDISEFTNTQ